MINQREFSDDMYQVIYRLNQLIDYFVEYFGTGGTFVPETIADADANNNTVYYSSTASKLVYKDASGVVNNLY